MKWILTKVKCRLFISDHFHFSLGLLDQFLRFFTEIFLFSWTPDVCLQGQSQLWETSELWDGWVPDQMDRIPVNESLLRLRRINQHLWPIQKSAELCVRFINNLKMFSRVCNIRGHGQESLKGSTGKQLSFKVRFKEAGSADGQSVRREIQREREEQQQHQKVEKQARNQGWRAWGSVWAAEVEEQIDEKKLIINTVSKWGEELWGELKHRNLAKVMVRSWAAEELKVEKWRSTISSYCISPVWGTRD